MAVAVRDVRVGRLLTFWVCTGFSRSAVGTLQNLYLPPPITTIIVDVDILLLLLIITARATHTLAQTAAATVSSRLTLVPLFESYV